MELARVGKAGDLIVLFSLLVREYGTERRCKTSDYFLARKEIKENWQVKHM